MDDGILPSTSIAEAQETQVQETQVQETPLIKNYDMTDIKNNFYI